jgi:hypothetical protein
MSSSPITAMAGGGASVSSGGISFRRTSSSFRSPSFSSLAFSSASSAFFFIASKRGVAAWAYFCAASGTSLSSFSFVSTPTSASHCWLNRPSPVRRVDAAAS